MRTNSDLFLGAGGDRVPPHGEGHAPGGPDPIPSYVGGIPVGDLSDAEGKVLGVVEGAVVPVEGGGWNPPSNFLVSGDELSFTLPSDSGMIVVSVDVDGHSQAAMGATDQNTGAMSMVGCSVSNGKSQLIALSDNGGFNFSEVGAVIATPNNLPGYHVDDEENSDGLLTENQSIVGAINELHRPLHIFEVELSPNGTIPATISDLFGPGWFIVSLIKAEKISGDCSAVTVRLLDGLTEVYKHAGADGTGNDLDTEAMTDRNVFSMENLSGNLTIEADSPTACVVGITLRVRAE